VRNSPAIAIAAAAAVGFLIARVVKSGLTPKTPANDGAEPTTPTPSPASETSPTA
jgi:hypothetical protein